MTRNFCTRTAKKLGRFGREKKHVRCLAQFCYIEMILVCGMFGFFGSAIPPIRSSPAMNARGTICGCPSRDVSACPLFLGN